jgi:hypothetical protein
MLVAGAVKTIRAISGRSGSGSSASVGLQRSLESRLQRQLGKVGSTLFSLTWKSRVTPAGRPYCQLAASARRISDSDYGSWPTPQAYGVTSPRDLGKRVKGDRQTRNPRFLGNTRKDLADVVGLASWTTPRANKWGEPDSHGKTVLGSLAQTERRGQLNPTFSLWLMGFPPEWESCAPQAMRSSRKLRRNS